MTSRLRKKKKKIAWASASNAAVQYICAFALIFCLFVVVSEKAKMSERLALAASNPEYFGDIAEQKTFEDVLKEVSKVEKEETKLATKHTEKDKICLAKNIFFEARGTDYFEKVRVANVTMNRLKDKSYPSTLCQVVKQHKQFSWTLVKTNTIERVKALVKKNSAEAAAWKDSLEIAQMAVDGELRDLTRGSLWYHTPAVSPKWSKDKEIAMVSDWHIYYNK